MRSKLWEGMYSSSVYVIELRGRFVAMGEDICQKRMLVIMGLVKFPCHLVEISFDKTSPSRFPFPMLLVTTLSTSSCGVPGSKSPEPSRKNDAPSRSTVSNIRWSSNCSWYSRPSQKCWIVSMCSRKRSRKVLSWQPITKYGQCHVILYGRGREPHRQIPSKLASTQNTAATELPDTIHCVLLLFVDKDGARRERWFMHVFHFHNCAHSDGPSVSHTGIYGRFHLPLPT